MTLTFSNGETWTYSYPSGDLTSVADDYGRELRFGYTGGKLWRVGDQTATGLETSTPTGRYVEYTYTSQKLNGVVYGSASLLSSVRDVLGKVWTYHYYGEASGETVADLVSTLLERTSPMVDLTGDGIADNTITLEKVEYASTSPYALMTQKRGQVGTGSFLEESEFTFQVNGGADTVTSVSQSVIPLETVHHFDRALHVGTTDPGDNTNSRTHSNKFRPTSQLDAKGNPTWLTWDDENDQKFLKAVADANGNETTFRVRHRQ